MAFVRKNVKKTIELVCSQCGKSFLKEKSEYERKVRNGYNKFYCSPICFHGSTIDELAPFRQTFYYAKQTAKYRKMMFDLTLQFLKFLWDRQRGICPYTGLPMELPSKVRDILKSPKQASIDRIDSNKGYTQDNVEYVMLFVNLGKNGFSKESIKNIFYEMRS